MFKVNDPVMGARFFNTLQEAEAVLVVVQKNLLVKENLRFAINTIEQLGLNTLWRTVEPTDPEIGEYKVYVYNKGTYETYYTMTEAKLRNESLKMEFLTEMLLDKVFEEDPPVEKSQSASNP